MKTPTTPLFKTAAAILACVAFVGTVRAADVIKADNATNLNDPAAWVGGATPTAADIAVWDNTVTVANTALFSFDTNWAGIRVADPGGLVTVSPLVSTAITAVGASPNLTYTVAPANPLVNGSRAVLSGTVAPTNFTYGVAYFVVNATATTFQLSATSGGTAITPTGPGANTTVTGHVLALGASGIDMSLATNGLTVGSPIALTANQTWNVTNGLTLTASAGVVGAAAITKSGNGTLFLPAAGSYTGGTVINAGVVQANNGSSFGTTGGITNNNGSTVRINTAVSIANQVNFNGTVTIDLNNFANNAAFTGNWSGSGTVNFINQNSAAVRTFTAGGSTANWTGFTGTINMGTNTGTLRLNDGGSSGNTGNSLATVDLGTTTATFLTRNRNAPVSLGVLLGGPGTRVLNGSSSSGTSTYSIGGKSVPFTFDGAFFDASATAALAITKVGTSTTILTGTNKYFGATTISAGTLQVGNGGTLGQLGSGPIINNAALVYNRSDAVTISNAISGSGNLTVQGGTVATFQGTNTSSGTLVVSAGAADVGVVGSIQCPVSLAAGTYLIVTNNPLFTLNQTLSGFGTVDGGLTAVGGTFRPGGPATGGTLTFLNNLTNSGPVTYEMELATAGPSDLINITGDLTVTATNSIIASKLGGGTLAVGTYPLINYSGTFNGTLDNFSVTVTGVTGTLTNAPGQIALIITPAARGATNLTWFGDGAANFWDVNTSTNWVNGVNQFKFLAGDSVRFDATGAANSIVTVNSAVVQPAAVVVDSTSNYTLTGNGSISGSTGLVKTNSGTLIVQTTNNYSGATVVGGGVLDINTVANGNSPSAIGAASSSPANLVLHNSTLLYSGASASTDRGATLVGGGNLNVLGANLTFSGSQIIGAGGLIKSGVGTVTLNNANTYSGGTVISNGVLALGSNSANNDGATGSGVGATNEVVTFRGGTLQLFGFNGSTTPNYSTFFNPLVVPAGETGTLRMFSRGPANSGANSGLKSSLTGSGTMNLVVNYVRDNLDGDWSAFTGLINVTPKPSGQGDEMRINNSFGYANASIFLNDGLTMSRVTGAGATTDIGELGGSSLAIIGPVTLSAVNQTWRVGGKNTTATFAGTITDNPLAATPDTYNVIKVGTGDWVLTGANLYHGTTTISNGVLSLSGSGAIDNSSLINIAAPGKLDVSTHATVALNLGNSANQTLGGDGTVLGDLSVGVLGTVAPGFSIGTLTVTNLATLGGNALMQVNRNGGSPIADKLTAASITYGGTLTIANIGAPLQVGDTFDLFDGALSGTFTTIVGGYYTWNTANLAVNGTVTVTGTLPLPTIGSATVVGTDLVLNSTDGAPNSTAIVVSSVDVGLPMASWTPVSTNSFDGVGAVTVTIPVDFNSPQRFFRFLLP